jgi:predicted ATPase
VRRILQRADLVPDDLVELIVGRCDGNPFFVEELLKMLVDDRVIRTDGPDGRWSIDGDRLALSRVPATLTGVLQARLDNLAPQELTVLQCASIVGRVFWDTSVAALHEEASTEQVRVSRTRPGPGSSSSHETSPCSPAATSSSSSTPCYEM